MNHRTQEAVVIAAGRGSRIAHTVSASHKCLIPLADRPLIGHIVESLAEAGVTRVHLVTGYAAGTLRLAIRGMSFRADVHPVHNTAWEKGNGTSVLAALRHVRSEHFLLSMADHWFVPQIPSLINAPGPGGNVLAVDRCIWNIADLDDATKVRTGTGNRIAEIGKELKQYDAIDCGLFLFRTDDLLGALQRAQSHGAFALSDGVRELIRQDVMFYADIDGLPWQDVDTQEDLQVALWKWRKQPAAVAV